MNVKIVALVAKDVLVKLQMIVFGVMIALYLIMIHVYVKMGHTIMTQYPKFNAKTVQNIVITVLHL